VGTGAPASPNGAYFFRTQPTILPGIGNLILMGGTSRLCVLGLSTPAPEGGTRITLKSSSPSVTFSNPITVPEGQTEVQYRIFTTPVAVDTRAEIIVQASGFVPTSATVKVLAPRVASLTFNKSEVNSGGVVQGTVKLTGEAPAAGFTVSLTQSVKDALKMPSSVTVPAGQLQGTFVANGGTLQLDTINVVSTGPMLPTRSRTIVIRNLVELESVGFAVTKIGLGQLTLGTVTLVSPAGASGQTVYLLSSNGSIKVPVSVNVPAGMKTATFKASSDGSSDAPAVISAVVGATVKKASLSFTANEIKSMALTRTRISELSSTVLRVTLTFPVPLSARAPKTIYITSSSTIVPTLKVLINPGQSTGSLEFKPKFTALMAPKLVELSAYYGTEKMVSLTVVPAITSFTVSPSSVTGGSTAVGKIVVFDPDRVLKQFTVTSNSSTAYFDSSTVGFPPTGGTTLTFLIRTRTRPTSTMATITITGHGYVRTAKLTIAAP
jgi:hypothetical protein